MDLARNKRGFCVGFAWNLILFSFMREREGYKHHADCTVYQKFQASKLFSVIVQPGGPPRGFGDSGRRAIYFHGFGEKGHLFSGIWGESMVLGSREQAAEEKHFRELGRKVIFLSGSREQRPPLGEPQPGLC